ncbi:MAG: DUF1501 domain-containing protein [Phycisphaera sp.]|nr:DUF1501 domain-containing protein [Phycisphaera sp.]
MNRRDFLAAGAAVGAAGALSVTSLPGLGGSVALAAKPGVKLGDVEHCIQVWLGGGMAQIDTFDPKAKGDAKKKQAGSYYASIDTAVKGAQVCEHLPNVANVLDRFALVRTVHHDVIDEHAAATNRMHTGRPTSGTIVYPSIGSLISHEKGAAEKGVPEYVLIGYPNLTRGPGFLGAAHTYLYLTDTSAGPAALTRAANIGADRQARRDALLAQVREGYMTHAQVDKQITAYDQMIAKASNLSGPRFMNVFNLDEEPRTLRDSYGGEFGQRCLLARRLCQSGVRFIEVSHNLNFVNGTGWDIHNSGILNQHVLIQEMDKALSTLVRDLEQHKMLDKTLIVVTSEFGRPAKFDGGGGRGHQGSCFTVALAGGACNGQIIGQTDELSKEILEQPVSVPDLFATIVAQMGIDPSTELHDGDRPVPITDMGKPVPQLFA